MTVTKPFYDNSNSLLGVSAVDVMFDSLFDHVTYYTKGQYSYAFLVNSEGEYVIVILPVVHGGN